MQTINTKESIAQLEKLLAKKLGYEINLTTNVRQGRDGEILEIESQELKGHTGIMAPFYETLKLNNFGGKVTGDGKEYWLPISFSFQYKSGGSNGTSIITAYFNFENNLWRLSE